MSERLLTLYDALEVLSVDPGDEYAYTRQLDACATEDRAEAIYRQIQTERSVLDQLEAKIERRREELARRDPEIEDKLQTLRHE